MRKPTYMLMLGVITLLTACGEDRSGEFYALIEDRMWIEETMQANYLWIEDMPAVKNENDYFQERSTFFKNRLSKTALNGRGDIYSYLTEDPKSEEESRSQTLNQTSTYGMEFMFANDPTGTTNHLFARVAFTLKGSPAEEAGIQRGDWLTSINGERITDSNYTQLIAGGTMKVTRGHIAETENGLALQKVDTVTIGPSKHMEINPFYTRNLYEVNGQKIAYLVYNEFSTGPTNQIDETDYNEQMKQIFADFKAQQPDAFILDLRYNNGGYLQCALALGSLLAPAQALGKNFVELTFNSSLGKPLQQYPLERQYADANLNLSRIYIITGFYTASASEVIINGLIPYMGKENVILIGEQTKGKNVAMNSFRNDTYGFTLHPVVAYVSNAEGYGDYSQGFEPTYEIAELNLTDWKPLGDPEEYLLKNTISLITTGTMPHLENESRSLVVQPVKINEPRAMMIVPTERP